MRRAPAIAGVMAGLFVASACSSAPERLDGQAGPVGGSSPSPSVDSSPAPPPSPSSPPSASSSPSPSSASPTSKTPTSPAANRLVLGPTGLGKLKIGMTRAQAEASGLITDIDGGSEGCGAATLKADPDGTVTYSPNLGVIAIPAYGRIATPEGIRIGSTLKQVQATYDDFEGSDVDETGNFNNGRGWAGGDDGNKVRYRFHFRDGEVEYLGLEHDDQDCYE
jgi:hypothetical protein